MDLKNNNPDNKQIPPSTNSPVEATPPSSKPISTSLANAAQSVSAPIKQALPNITPGNISAIAKKQGKFKSLFNKIKNKWNSWSKVKKAIAVFVALVFVTGIAAGTYLLVHKPAKQSTKTVKVVTPTKPVTMASPLTGVQVAPALAKRPVTGVMIENSTDARPQSGLQDAGAVFEAIAEGGITRFLALFQDTTPQYIGPVRSIRPYYIDFAQPFQASIAHVGGSPDALSRIRNGSYRDLDQFFNSTYYTRVSSRAAPHNVYTSTDNLDNLNKAKGYTTSTFTSWVRKDDAKLTTPTANSIDFAISSYYFNVHYDYNPATNGYSRSEGGATHLNLVSATDKTGVQLAPKVVIAVVMPFTINADGQHTDYADTGSGNAYIFQDGGVTVGKWNKADAATQLTFTDTAGAPLKLNAGQTWISLVSSDSDVTYTAPAPTPAKTQ